MTVGDSPGSNQWRAGPRELGVTSPADRWIRLTAIGCVGFSLLSREPSRICTCTCWWRCTDSLGGSPRAHPLSVDGMIVAASTTLFADSRSGCRGGILPWGAVDHRQRGQLGGQHRRGRAHAHRPSHCAWPSFALTASYELLTRQVRRSAVSDDHQRDEKRQRQRSTATRTGAATGLPLLDHPIARKPLRAAMLYGARRGSGR